MNNNLLLGDCLETLRSLDADSIDSLVTDPPAGISFMGKDWDKDKGGRDPWIEWMTGVMRECHRVMKPGAHGFVWALPRTSHWTATALEDAGFEIRDVVTHLFGTGFPKSLNVSKAIDKADGAEREVVGSLADIHPRYKSKRKPLHGGNMGTESAPPLTAPATPEAKQWDGWGTALKPANEHWILIRKKLSEKTVAKNVLKHGTGGINVDASRVGSNRPPTTPQSKPTSFQNDGRSKVVAVTNADTKTDKGRFPSNLIVSHSPNCEPSPMVYKDGSTASQCADDCARKALDEQSLVGGMHGAGKARKSDRHGKAKGLFPMHGSGGHRIGDSGGASRFFYCAKESKKGRNNGVETHLSWENQDQNLADQMAELSLQLKAIFGDTTPNPNDIEWSTISFGKNDTERSQKAIKSTIEITLRLITELKTSNWSPLLNTKDFIRDAIETIEESGSSLVESAECFKKLKTTTTNVNLGLVLGASLAVSETLLKMRQIAKVGNVHSTVKAQKLMRYLITMITPPGGKVLDPFMGSGSTGVAAKSDGFEFVGIEREAEYFEIAKARII